MGARRLDGGHPGSKGGAAGPGAGGARQGSSSGAGAGADKAGGRAAQAGLGSKGSAGGMPEAQARDADQQALISQSGGNTAAGSNTGAKAAAQKVTVSVSKSQPRNAQDPGKAGGQAGQAGPWDGPEEALTKEKNGKDSDGAKEVGSMPCRHLPPTMPLVPPLLSHWSPAAFWYIATDLIAAS